MIVITGGIPESGDSEKEINIEYSHLLSETVDIVFLLKTRLYKYLYSNPIKEISHTKYSVLKSLEYIEKNYCPTEFVILCQPELNDLYYL